MYLNLRARVLKTWKAKRRMKKQMNEKRINLLI